MADAPFKVGDRVRYVGKRWRKLTRGTVRRVRRTAYPGAFWVKIDLDGGAATASTEVHLRLGNAPHDWRVVPLSDWTLDETAQALARAVMEKRDAQAVWALNDRLTELRMEGAQ